MSDKRREEPSLGQQAEAALKEAVQKVAQEARRTGATLVIWQEGTVVEISADQLPPPTAETK